MNNHKANFYNEYVTPEDIHPVILWAPYDLG